MATTKTANVRVRVNFKIRKDLKDWIFDYAKENNVNVTALIEDYFFALREQHKDFNKHSEGEVVKQI